jgi:hypothetical protein
VERKVLITGISGQERLSVSTPISPKRLGARRTEIVLGRPFVRPFSYDAGQTQDVRFLKKAELPTVISLIPQERMLVRTRQLRTTRKGRR